MNDSSKIKLLAALVVILVLVNISMMGYLWYAPHVDRPGGPRDGHGPGGLVIKELKFDAKQQEQFEKLRNEHHAAMVEIDKASHQLHGQLFKILSEADSTSQQKSDSILTEISNREKSREHITYLHLAAVRNICTPEQQKIFDDMIAKASARPPDGPPHRPGPPPGDRP